MVDFPAICFVAEGERGQLATVLLLQLRFIFAPHQRRGNTVTGCVLRDQSLIVPTKVAFQRCDLTGQAAEIDPATCGQGYEGGKNGLGNPHRASQNGGVEDSSSR